MQLQDRAVEASDGAQPNNGCVLIAGKPNGMELPGPVVLRSDLPPVSRYIPQMFGLPIPVLLVACVGCGLWVWWLWLRTKAPRWACAISAMLSLTVAMTVLLAVYGLYSSFAALGAGGHSSQRTKTLADGISLSIQSLEYGSVAALVNLVMLLMLTWKYHWSLGKKSLPTP